MSRVYDYTCNQHGGRCIKPCTCTTSDCRMSHTYTYKYTYTVHVHTQPCKKVRLKGRFGKEGYQCRTLRTREEELTCNTCTYVYLYMYTDNLPMTDFLSLPKAQMQQRLPGTVNFVKLHRELKYLGRIPRALARLYIHCLLYTSPSPRDATLSRMPSSA